PVTPPTNPVTPPTNPVTPPTNPTQPSNPLLSQQDQTRLDKDMQGQAVENKTEIQENSNSGLCAIPSRSDQLQVEFPGLPICRRVND
ncbi:MAG: hypothetical protein IGS39_10435, partial [Calothrix sp. C42_A2020_038]|nr:hypothetical protein [Calothrix sp. C42_A2020_038]